MKKLTALALLFTFLFNTIGCYVILVVQKYQVRREMISRLKENLSSDELTLIKITPNSKPDLHWRDAHEFMYKGIMYDVVKAEKINKETVIYYCIPDTLEMKLLTELENQFNKNKSSKSSKTNVDNGFIKVIPKVEDKFFTPITNLLLINNKITSLYSNLYDSLKLDIESPPPKLV